MAGIGVGIAGEEGEEATVIIVREGMETIAGAVIMSTEGLLGIEVEAVGVGKRGRSLRSLWGTGCSDDGSSLGRETVEHSRPWRGLELAWYGRDYGSRCAATDVR